MKNKIYLPASFVLLLMFYSCKKEAALPPTIAQKPDSTAQNVLFIEGLGMQLTAGKSLNKSYDYYFDQFDGSTYQYINCGPAVSSMAIKWADSTFTKTPSDARLTITENGGDWYTSDITAYLSMYQVNSTIVSFTSAGADEVIRNSIDHNNTVILCLDMFYALYNPINYQHTNKFYFTNAPAWGHFLLVKGYKQVDGKLYYEIYDPYTDHNQYNGGLPKGKDRYYLNTTITDATDVWWQYAIVVAPKGQQVTTSTRLQVSSLEHIPLASGR
jgi:hypothetical protein